jgi:hypothetical protein
MRSYTQNILTSIRQLQDFLREKKIESSSRIRPDCAVLRSGGTAQEAAERLKRSARDGTEISAAETRKNRKTEERAEDQEFQSRRDGQPSHLHEYFDHKDHAANQEDRQDICISGSSRLIR